MMLNDPKPPSKAEYAAALKVLHERIRECFGWEPEQYGGVLVANKFGEVAPLLLFAPSIAKVLAQGRTLIFTEGIGNQPVTFRFLPLKESSK